LMRSASGATASGRRRRAERTGSFYEALGVKSKLSFSLSGCPRCAPSTLTCRGFGFSLSLGSRRLFCATTSWVNHPVVAWSTGGFAGRDAGSRRRWLATTFSACRPEGRGTRVWFRPLAIRRSLVPGRPSSSTVVLAHPPGTCVRSPGPALDATKPALHPDFW
jgi:hypothetical protein